MQERFETFTRLLAQISRSIRKLKTENMAECNLKSQHLSCLYYLYTDGPMTVRELRDLADEDKANMSRSIDYLEENGYLFGLPDAVCRHYKRRLALTEKGKTVAAELAHRLDRVLSRVGADIPESDRATMYRCLCIISENLQDLCTGLPVT